MISRLADFLLANKNGVTAQFAIGATRIAIDRCCRYAEASDETTKRRNANTANVRYVHRQQSMQILKFHAAGRHIRNRSSLRNFPRKSMTSDRYFLHFVFFFAYDDETHLQLIHYLPRYVKNTCLDKRYYLDNVCRYIISKKDLCIFNF